jgi:5-methylcytosine-specific restriction protein A
MPPRTPKRCREQGCGQSSTERHGYCEQHAHLASWGKHQQQEQRKGRRVYQTSEWQRTAKEVKTIAQHLCINCLLGTPKRFVVGTICEHIIPKARGGGENYQNLSCFCVDCAKEKTNWEQKQSTKSILDRYGHTSIDRLMAPVGGQNC